jgi:hypothetical protein
VPLEQFDAIKVLTPEQKRGFEIIDGNQLSFLSLDEIYALSELIGIE